MPRVGKIEFSPSAYSVANNETPLNIKGIITTTGDAWKGDHRTGTIVVTQDGTTIYNGSFTHGAPLNSTTTLFSIDITVKHKSDGNSGTIAASYNYDAGWCKASNATTLTKIPRQALISSAPNFNDEENPTITYSNPPGNNATLLKACISLDGSKDDIPYRDIDMNGTSYTFELTEDEREILRTATTGSNKRKVIFFVRTVIDDTPLYSTLEKEFTVINATPTLAPTVVDVNEATIALTGDASILVRGQSDAEVHTGAQVYKSAGIKAQKIICGSSSINGEGGTINDVGSGAFIFSVTDTRENVVTQTVNVPFIEYVKLTCNLVANAPDAEGDIVFAVSGNCFSGSFGVADNSVKVYYRYKVGEETYGDWREWPEVTLADNTYIANVSLSGLDYTKKHTFQAMATDSLMESTSAERIVKTIPVFDWGEHDFNFNVPVNVNGDLSIDETKMDDYIVEQGVSGIWTYTKWASGEVKLRGYTEFSGDVNVSLGNGYRSAPQSVALPFKVYKPLVFTDCCDLNTWSSSHSYPTVHENTAVSYVLYRLSTYTGAWIINLLVVGRWK